MTHLEQRLIRKQARLTQKLERIKTKLANRALLVQTRRVRAHRNPYVSTVRGIVTGLAFAGFWWLGCNRINGVIDDLFGESNAAPQQPAASTAHAQTFWTFGRRRRSGESQIRPAG
jgi:hypothetical protein